MLVVTITVLIADRVFDESATTREIHEELISPIVQSVMKGIHGQYMLLLVLHNITVGIYQISGSCWPDIQPFFKYPILVLAKTLNGTGYCKWIYHLRNIDIGKFTYLVASFK